MGSNKCSLNQQTTFRNSVLMMHVKCTCEQTFLLSGLLVLACFSQDLGTVESSGLFLNLETHKACLHCAIDYPVEI